MGWLVLFVSALFFESCIKSEYKPFETPPDLTNAEKTLVDTFTLNLETYGIDSLNSSWKNYLFAGGFKSQLGTISTKSYFQYLPQTFNLPYPTDTLIIDSTVMLFRETANYGDFKDTIGFRLRELSENLDGDRSYYTFDTFTKVHADSLYVFGDTNKINYTYRFPIHKLGKRIMADWKAKGSFKNAADFQSKFHGFELTYPNPSRISRFDMANISTSVITSGFYVYCHTVVKGTKTPRVYYFQANTGLPQFYHIETTREGYWASLPPYGGLPATNVGSQVAVQAGTALAVKIKVPGLAAWSKNLPGKIKIFKAELYIKPNAGVTILPPEYLRISSQTGYYSQVNPETAVYNDANIQSLLSLNAASNLTKAGAKLYASALVFPYNPVSGEYKCNITSYVQDVVDGRVTTDDLNLYSQEMGSSLNELIITKTADQSNLRLKVFYYKN